MMTQIFIASGCDGQATHTQLWDNAPLQGRFIVWRRSVPHAKSWPSVYSWTTGILDQGYSPAFVVINRDWYPTACSQVSHKHVLDMDEAYANIKRAYNLIYSELYSLGYNYTAISYESIVRDPKGSLSKLSNRIRYELNSIDIQDQNSKWYGEMS